MENGNSLEREQIERDLNLFNDTLSDIDDEEGDETYTVSRNDLKVLRSDQKDDASIADGKKRKKKGDKIDGSSRPKRVCSKPNRLGRRESAINHNQFFEDLSKQQSQSSSDGDSNSDINLELVKTITCSSKSKQTVPEDVLLIDDSLSSVSQFESSTQHKCCSHDAEFKTLMIAHMTAIKEHLVRLEVKIGHQRNTSDSLSGASGILDVIKLKNFGAPVDSEQKLLVLDKNLKDEQYRNDLFNVLKDVGGDKGASIGDKVIEPVVYALIEPAFLANISWTGRGKGNERKIALKKFVNITNLITFTINKADNRCVQDDILKLLKYKVLKYASVKGKDEPTSELADDLRAVGQAASPVHSECSTKSNESESSGVELSESKSLSPSSSQTCIPHILPGMSSMPNFGQFYGQYPGMGSYPMGAWPFNPYQRSNGTNDHSK